MYPKSNPNIIGMIIGFRIRNAMIKIPRISKPAMLCFIILLSVIVL